MDFGGAKLKLFKLLQKDKSGDRGVASLSSIFGAKFAANAFTSKIKSKKAAAAEAQASTSVADGKA